MVLTLDEIYENVEMPPLSVREEQLLAEDEALAD
jgi:hypothetical protein